MTWTLVLLGFGLTVLMGAGLASLLTTIRPEWSTRRRLLIAASALPGITAVATLVGLLFIATAVHGESERKDDLAMAAMASIGGGFTILALVGGLIGALLAGRRRRS